MAKLDQDNKLLAELDEKVLLNQKIRTANPSFKSSSLQQANSLLANVAAATQLHSSLPSLNHSAGNLLNLSSLASKNLLSALEGDLTGNSYSGLAGLNAGGLSAAGLVSNLGAANLLGSTSLSAAAGLDNRQALSQPTLNATSALTSALNNVANQQKQLQNQIQHQIQQQQQLLNSNLASANLHAASINNPPPPPPPPVQHHQHSSSAQDHHANEIRIAEDIVDSIEIANRGRFRVFIARYSYDPFKQSPNEHPEAELHLNAGDFLLVQVFCFYSSFC